MSPHSVTQKVFLSLQQKIHLSASPPTTFHEGLLPSPKTSVARNKANVEREEYLPSHQSILKDEKLFESR